MFGLVLAFVHWGYVYLLHCIIIEHIPECLVWWDSVSYVSYYPTLGHTPILEFIGYFADSLTTQSISWFLWVVTLGHTPILEFIGSFADSLTTQSISWSLWVITLGHTLILQFIRSFVYFLTARSISWSLWVVILGHTPLELDLGHFPLFGFAMSRADFMIVRRICRSLRVIT